MSAILRPLCKLREALCWRLARTESQPLGELVAPSELSTLMAFLEETVGLRDEPTWADRPFRAPNPGGSRFSDGNFGVFYAGLDMATCLAEMAYHQKIQMLLSRAPGMRIHFIGLRAKASGDFLDVRHGHDRLHRPRSYADSRVFAVRAWKAGADGIAYRSVRRPGGECLAVFKRTCIGSCAKAGLVTLEWDGTDIRVAN